MSQNNKPIFVVGLTGNIGSGKSTISNLLREKKIPIIDADVVSREVLIKHPRLMEEIKSAFGKEYFDEKGNLLRKKLGTFVFSSKEKKLELEKIMIPYIIKDIFEKIKEYDSNGYDFCIVDAPTLVENNLHFYMNAIILVTVDKENQINRIMMRDSLTMNEAIIRINSQMTQEEKIKYADFIIDNNGNMEATIQQLERVLKSLEDLRGKNGKKKQVPSINYSIHNINNPNKL
jgi:dephospho-CoA kinase